LQSTGTAPETTTVANVTVELVPDSRFVRNALRIVSGLAKPQRDATRCNGVSLSSSLVSDRCHACEDGKHTS